MVKFTLKTCWVSTEKFRLAGENIYLLIVNKIEEGTKLDEKVDDFSFILIH